MNNRWLMLVVFIGAVTVTGAQEDAGPEVGYVTDVLQLGLHRAEDGSDEPFDVVTSGVTLEILERAGAYARVRAADGREGWVRSAFLVGEPPASHRLATLEQELETLRSDLARARAARISAEEESARLRRQAAGHTESLGQTQTTLSRLRQQNEQYQSRLERYRGSVPLVWAAAALLVALTGGFVAGVWWLDALIRRRHGGFRIY